METQASDLKWRLRRIERTTLYLFFQGQIKHAVLCFLGQGLRLPRDGSMKECPGTGTVRFALQPSQRLGCEVQTVQHWPQ